MAARRVAVIVGSLRKEAFSRRVANALRAVQPPALDLQIVEIRDLPFYNADLETDAPPAAWTAFRDAIRSHDAVLFVSPEYNRSMPAALKNAIDVGSRPYGKASIVGKPCAVVTTSPGVLGGFSANHQIRQAVVFLDMPMLQMPEMYIGGVDKVVGADGAIQGDARKLFDAFLQKFATWIESNVRAA
jgi:chromate reductase, NAD(P)H dehydrogenase (quinone)